MKTRLRYSLFVALTGITYTICSASAETISWKNSTLIDDSLTVTIASKETLSISGENDITIKSLELEDGATLQFDVSASAQSTSILNLDAELHTGWISLSLSRNALTQGENYTLLHLANASQYDDTNWVPDKVSLKGEKSSFYDYSWNNGNLIYNYRSTYYNGTYSYKGNNTRTTRRVFSDYLSLQFENNISEYYSGSVIQTSYSPATFTNNGEITFKNNKVTNSYSCGGAIDGSVTFTGNGSISFLDNNCPWYGGAIHGGGTYSDNENIVFERNSATNGGALISGAFTNNKNILFSENHASYGGAIYTDAYTLSFTGNDRIDFSNNSAAKGGAIYYARTNELGFSHNGSISFINNIASGGEGAAIYSSNGLCFNDNGDVNISWNTAYNNRFNPPLSAIYARGNSFSFLNNDCVLVRGNAIVIGTAYYLRGIYVEGSAADSPIHFMLDTQTGQSITFHDSIYADENTVTVLNGEGCGTITFTGETTVEDLNTVLAAKNAKRSVSERDEEVITSRTSQLHGTTTLSGGNLIIKEKAILNISNLTVEGGNITVATGAQLNLSDRDITMPALTLAGGTVTLGTEDKHDAALTISSLTVTDNSTLNADLVIATNGSITFDFGGSDDKKLTMGCSVTLGENYKIYLDHATITMLKNGANAESITLMNDIERIQDILLADGVCAYDTETNEESDILLYTESASDGTKSLKATKRTPEPATATLSLLALAALASRRKRN